jgi:hypothetical protein
LNAGGGFKGGGLEEHIQTAQQEGHKCPNRDPRSVVDQELDHLNQANVSIGNVVVILVWHPRNYGGAMSNFLLSKILF